MIFKKSKQRTGPSTNQKYPEGRDLGPFNVKCPKTQMGKAAQTREGGTSTPSVNVKYK